MTKSKPPTKLDSAVASIIKALGNMQIVGAILIVAFLIYEFFAKLT